MNGRIVPPNCTALHWMVLWPSREQKQQQPPRCFPVKYVVSFFRVLNFASSSFASVSQPSQLSQDAMVLLIVGACKLEENSHRTTNQTSTEIYGHSLCDLFWRLHWTDIRPRALTTTTHHSRCIVVESLLYGHTTMLTNGSGCRRVVVADKSPGFSHSANHHGFVYFRWLSYLLATGKLPVTGLMRRLREGMICSEIIITRNLWEKKITVKTKLNQM